LARTAPPADVIFMEHTVCWHSLDYKVFEDLTLPPIQLG